MNRNLTLALAGLAIVALGVSCDDESTTDTSSSTTSTSTSSSSGDTGGSGGDGGMGGSTSSSSTTSSSSSSSGSIPPCGSTVQGGDVCPQLGAHCTTATSGCCQCLELVGCNPDPIWACLEPANDPGCTTEVPVHGETCGTEGLLCEYCLATGVEIWRCHNLTWVAQMPGCGD